MPTTKNKICPDCGKSIWSSSVRCKSCSSKGELGSFFGKHHSKETLEKLSGENSYHWKGDNAKYKAIHIWVNKHRGKPKICEHCKTSKIKLEWANKDHKYRRNLDDYFSLCCNCHIKYDLANGFKQSRKGKKYIDGKFI